jgi:type IV secretion system protein VirD4
MRLPSNKQLVLIENMNPIIADKVPWFEDAELKERGKSLRT